MWYILLLPVLITICGYWLYPHRITLIELGVPVLAGFLTILISYFTMKEVTLRDIEYNGDLIVSANYFESYESWVSKTCSYRVSCGKNCWRTVYYDCSYCNFTPESFEVVTRTGKKAGVSRTRYEYLLKKWNAEPQFFELGRSINFRGSCGKDGDAYNIAWDGQVLTSEAFVWEVPFANPVKASHSAFKFEDITKDQADTLGLYHYPAFFDLYRQPGVLAKDFRFKESVYRQFEYLNGNLGPAKKVKVFTLLFKNKDIHLAALQEQYWEGGNQNEIVVCLGVDDKLNITWVKPFSWCDNKRLHVDLREDISEMGVFDPSAVLKIYERVINKEFKYKSFSDFNYLKFEPTVTQLLWVIFVTVFVSVISTIIIIRNEVNPF